jgi:hypothetical protein
MRRILVFGSPLALTALVACGSLADAGHSAGADDAGGASHDGGGEVVPVGGERLGDGDGEGEGNDEASTIASADTGDECSDPGACAGKCGSLFDRCGHIALCGACPAGEVCGGAGVASVCGVVSGCHQKPGDRALVLDGTQAVTVSALGTASAPGLTALLGATGDFTIEVWVMFPTSSSIPPGTPGTDPFSFFVGKPVGTSTADSLGVYFQSGFGFDSTEGSSTQAQAYNAALQFSQPIVGRWYHIALSYSSAQMADTIDVFDPSTASAVVVSTAGLPVAYDGNPLAIGADVDNGVLAHFFTGELDELYLWNAVRSPDDVARDRANCTAAPSPGLVGYWSFDGDLSDASGNGNDGAPSGAPVSYDTSPRVPF